MRSEAMGVASAAEIQVNSSEDKLMLTTEDFPVFSCRPKKSENMSSMVETWCAATVDPRKKNVVSSKYCSNGMPPGLPVVWNPTR